MKTFLSARWENLIMANYAVDPEILKPYLPNGVELDFFEGKTYVSLVGFMFKNTRIFGVPVPFLGTFEEVNLRFYVKRHDRRGVVFINESVPYQPVAWLANKLYKEHYISIPTKHKICLSQDQKYVEYRWKIASQWNHLQVKAFSDQREMQEGSLEEFIFEHYYGYTRVSDTATEEYKVNHPRWTVNTIQEFDLNCDYLSMYGSDFEHLSVAQPDSVIIADGSSISVDWKRKRL
jgi:uncharacterized protein YqjF (DUF2071 family)